MFHFGPDAGFNLLGLQLIRIQLLASARALGNEPGHIFTMLMLSPFLDAQVTGIAEHLLLITVQQFIGGYDVVDVGGRSVDAVNQPECVVDTDVHLHAEVPLVTLPGLVHFWRSADAVTLAALILGGARCRNDAFIHDAAFAQHQAILLQVLVHLFEQHLAKAVALHEMTKLEDGGFVRQTIQLQTSGAPHGFDLVERIFLAGSLRL